MQNSNDRGEAIPGTSEAAPLSDEQRRELQCRLAEHRANPDSAIPWDEARARLRNRFRA